MVFVQEFTYVLDIVNCLLCYLATNLLSNNSNKQSLDCLGDMLLRFNV